MTTAAKGAAHAETPEDRPRPARPYSQRNGLYDALGKTGGAKTHTHTGHADHHHTLNAGEVLAGGIYCSPVTGGVQGGDAGNTLKHDAHSTQDHRPPFITRVWIKRTS